MAQLNNEHEGQSEFSTILRRMQRRIRRYLIYSKKVNASKKKRFFVNFLTNTIRRSDPLINPLATYLVSLIQ